MAIHSSALAWRILWTEKPGRLQSMQLQRSAHDSATNTSVGLILTNIGLDYGIFYKIFKGYTPFTVVIK